MPANGNSRDNEPIIPAVLTTLVLVLWTQIVWSLI